MRLYMIGGTRFTMGVYNFEGGYSDAFFAVIPPSGAVTDYHSILIPNITHFNTVETNQRISSSGALWTIIPYRSKPTVTNDIDKNGFYAIAVNGIDQPWAIVDGTLAGTNVTSSNGSTFTNVNGVPMPAPLQAQNYPFFAIPMQVVSSNNAGSVPLVATDTTSKVLIAPRTIVSYNAAVVWGGFRMGTQSTHHSVSSSNVDNYDNYIAFSDIGLPHQLAQTGGVISTIRIGDSDQEPITAMGLSTTPTDTQGLKGQLCVWTGQRLTMFDGIPPSTDNPQGVNFSSVIFKSVGCNAPKSVVQTPYGLCFLGSDGFIYCIRGLAGPERIGNAVWEVFRSMSPRQQLQCAAYYDSRGYYKISYPETGHHADFGPSVTFISPFLGGIDTHYTNTPLQAEGLYNNRQLWADLREMQPPGSAKDIGVLWYGPMTGMQHACFCVASGAEDRGEMYAGSAIDGSIYQVNLDALTTDPIPTNPQVVQSIDTLAITGVFDMGDAQVDKTVSGFNYGMGTDRATTVYASCIVTPSDAGTAQIQADFTDTIAPPGGLIDSTLVADTDQAVSGDSIITVPHRPETRLRGKMFRFIFHESASAGAKIFYSDLQFRSLTAPRRK